MLSDEWDSCTLKEEGRPPSTPVGVCPFAPRQSLCHQLSSGKMPVAQSHGAMTASCVHPATARNEQWARGQPCSAGSMPRAPLLSSCAGICRYISEMRTGMRRITRAGLHMHAAAPSAARIICHAWSRQCLSLEPETELLLEARDTVHRFLPP